jgi:hypothetical protein
LAASGEGLQAFLGRMKGASVKERVKAMKALSKAEKKQLHTEYRALSPEGKKAANEALGRGQKAKGRAAKTPKTNQGTIQYDTGVAHPFRTSTFKVTGNAFFGGALRNTHTLTQVTAQAAGTFGGTSIGVFGPPAGTFAPLIDYFATQLQIGVPVVIPLTTPIAGTGVFEMGQSQSGSSTTPSSTFKAAAVDVNVGPQGFHGMTIYASGGGFNPNPTVFPGQPFSTIIRATGLLVPVELMNFNVQ